MTTFTGKKFWPMDPRADEVCIEDIAHALSMICRFGGHCKYFYSVAQHSCLVADFVASIDKELALSALLHDAAEAYVGDLIRPIKATFAEFKVIEARVELAICQRFSLGSPNNAVIKWADNVLLKNEHREIMQDGNTWQVDSIEGPQLDIVPMLHNSAEAMFLHMFEVWSDICVQ